MRLLLDTHLLLWAAEDSPRLSSVARALLSDPQNDLSFSAASIWEVAIKAGQRRAGFQVDPRVLRRALTDNGYEEIAVTSDHCVAILGLPPIHGDPFDRILIAVAIAEGLTLLTSDSTVAQYPAPIRLV